MTYPPSPYGQQPPQHPQPNVQPPGMGYEPYPVYQQPQPTQPPVAQPPIVQPSPNTAPYGFVDAPAPGPFPPQYGMPTPPPRGNGGAVIAVISVVAVLVIAVVSTVLFVTADDDGDDDSSRSNAASTPSVSLSPTPTEVPHDRASIRKGVDALFDAWEDRDLGEIEDAMCEEPLVEPASFLEEERKVGPATIAKDHEISDTEHSALVVWAFTGTDGKAEPYSTELVLEWEDGEWKPCDMIHPDDSDLATS